MSKQLSISAAFSVFAMAAFAVLTPALQPGGYATGAAITTAAPAFKASLPEAPALPAFLR